MKRIIFCIVILLYPNLLIASDRDLVIESSLMQIHDSYADSYLTFNGSLKGLYGNTLSKLGIKLSGELEKYIEGKDMFESTVRSYNMFVDDYGLSLNLSPEEFKSAFNDEVKNRLGEKSLKIISLDINKKYPVR